MKKDKIIYWTATTIIALFEGVMPALTSQTELAKEGIKQLGYPEYFGNVLKCHYGCKITWCKDCLITPYHEYKSCIEVEYENKKSENGKFIWDMNNKGLLKFCPDCKAPSIKNNGCNKMICSNCNVIWCWLCLTTQIDYDHYNTILSGLCKGKLWEGVDSNGNDIHN